MPTRQQIQFGAAVAAIAAIVGLLSSLFTLYTQINTVVGSWLREDFAPVGTIVSSVLPPAQFQKLVGGCRGCKDDENKWVLADGSEVKGSKYAQLTEGKSVPNLQGVFLRGIDESKKDREAGSKQDYGTALPKKAFKGTASHAPGYSINTSSENPRERYNAGGSSYGVVSILSTQIPPHSHSIEVTEGGDEETRPVNVAVYYYIKIN